MPIIPEPANDYTPTPVHALRRRQLVHQMRDTLRNPAAAAELARTSRVMGRAPLSAASLAGRVLSVIERDLHPYDREIRANFHPDALGAVVAHLNRAWRFDCGRVLVISRQPEYPAITMADHGCDVTATYPDNRQAATYRSALASAGYSIKTIVTDVYRPNVAQLGGDWQAIIVDNTLSQLPPIGGDRIARHLIADLAPLAPRGVLYVIDGGWRRDLPYRPLRFLRHARTPSVPTYTREPHVIYRHIRAAGLATTEHREVTNPHNGYRTHHYVAIEAGY